MLCPEGTVVQNEPLEKEEETICPKIDRKMPAEGVEGGSVELSSYKNPKSWKKSLTNFFRNQLRSTRSNDGDRPSVQNLQKFEEKELSPEQKWQSLGKMFRRQSLGEHWNKYQSNQQGESSSQNKRLAVKKVLSSYFGKSQKPMLSVSKEN